MRKPSFHLKSYPWYVSDWRMSETRLRLSPLGRYIYRELLDQCYLDGSIPGDERILSKLVDVPHREFMREWPTVRLSFQQDEAGRYHNRKTDETLVELERWHNQKRSAGRAGGRARAEADAKRTLDERQAFAKPRAEAFAKPSTSTSTSTSTSVSEEPPTPLPDPPPAAVLEIVLAKPDPVLATLDECERLYAMAGKPIPERHRNLAVQLLIGIQHDKLPRLPNYIRWALASGTWSDAAHTKGFLKLLHDGDWDVDLTMRTLPTAAQNRTKTDIAQDEETRNFLRKRGAL